MNVDDFLLTCRICLKKKDSLHFLIPLSLQIEGLTIIQLIAACSSVEIDLNESPNLPQNVCHLCLEQIKTANEISRKIVESHETLKTYAVETDEDLQPHPVFVDVIKQEKFVLEDSPVKITFQASPEPAEFDDFFADSYANDSSESEPELFKFVPNMAVKKIIVKELKVIVPRLSSPCCYENSDEKNFICDGCGIKFPNRTSFRLHFSKMHRKKRVHQCKICHQTFRFSNGLKVHQKYHTDEKNFTCPMCPRRYVLKMELKKHILTHSCNDLEICGGCAKAFSSSYLQKHKPNCKNKATKAEIAKAVGDLGTEYRCDQCGLKIYGKLFLSKHMKRTHLVNFLKEFVCNKCDEVFKSSFDLLVHSRQVHRKMKVVNCEFCGRKFIKKSMLKIHQKSRACSANHFVCKTCQKPFKTKQGFENHQKFCGNEKKVLKDVKKPKEPKNWICEFCGIHLTTQPGHRRHLISRHRDVMYTKPPTKLNCPYPNCVKVFYYKFDLKNHIDCKHLKLRDYKCDLCSKGYALACGLRRHMKLIHNKTNEEKEITKIFVCSFCPAKYEKENALSKHLQHHDLTLPNRSFHCLICTRSFKLKKLLNLHIRTKHPT